MYADANFFDHPFSEDIGDVLFGANKKADGLDFSSPDNTTDGNLKKRWKIIDGKRCLVKGGSNPFRQQPFNEVIATGIMERLGIPHVPYTLTWSKGAPYSVCEDFVTKDIDLVPAWRILNTDVEILIKNVLSADGAEEYIDERRIQAISGSVRRRISYFSQLVKKQAPVQTASTQDDVAENIAEAYHS